MSTMNVSVTLAIASYTRAVHIPLIVGSNSLVLITFMHVSKLDTPDNYAIAALALADLLIGLVYIPLVLMETYDKDIFNRSHFSCMFDFPFRFFLLTLSMSFMMLLTVDRYIAIAHPFFYNEHVTNASIAWSAFGLSVLDFSVFVALLGYLVEQHIPYTHGVMVHCSKDLIPDWFFILATAFVGIQEITSLVCTIMVSIDAWRSLRNRETLQRRFVDREHILKVKNQLKMTILMNFLFVVLVIPSIIGPWLGRKHAVGMDERTVVAICTHPLLLNSSTNALVYALSRPIYRHSFGYILTHAPNKWNELSHYVLRLFSLKVKNQSQFSTRSTSKSTVSVNVIPSTSVNNKFKKKDESFPFLAAFFRKITKKGKVDKQLEKNKTAKENTRRKRAEDREDIPYSRKLRLSLNTETTVTGSTVTSTSDIFPGTEAASEVTTGSTKGTPTGTPIAGWPLRSARNSRQNPSTSVSQLEVP